jgi:hypothetical protein
MSNDLHPGPGLYHLYGLRVLSEVPLPEAVLLEAPGDLSTLEPDVRVEEGPMPSGIPDGREFASWIVADRRSCLLRFEGVGSFYVEDGRRIVAERAEGATFDDLRGFLIGSAFGAILHMRGLVPLHVSALATPDGVFAFTGQSGAGKSTLAASLNQHNNWPMICDDVAVVSNHEGSCTIVSGVNTVKLWGDALVALNRSSEGLRRDLTRHDKFHAIEGSRFMRTSAPLRRLVQLTWGDELSYRKTGGLNAFKIALEAVYRPEFIALFSDVQKVSAAAAATASNVEIGILTRPKDHSRSADIAQLLESKASMTVTR